MTPKQRRETLATITIDNMTINNVNHVKEYLLLEKLPLHNFAELVSEIHERGLPEILIQYCDEKGLVISDKMRQLLAKNELKYTDG